MDTDRMPSLEMARWTNWGGNQSFDARRLAVSSEEMMVSAVHDVRDAGSTMRVAGAGHSFTPIVETAGVLVDLDLPTGIIDVEDVTSTAHFWAQTPLSSVGPALWKHGFSLCNQGDTDGQTLAGAIATGTKGSGTRLGSISSQVRQVSLVDGTGRFRVIDSTQAEHLRAAQVAIGMLGIFTRIGLEVEAAYGLAEHNEIVPVAEILSSARERLDDYRHFSFCWCPTAETGQQFHLPDTLKDECFVKQLSYVPGDHPALQGPAGVAGEPNERIGRNYVIHPDWADQHGDHIELEYMFDAAVWADAFLALRDLMQRQFPEETSPVQVRWQKADEAFLSAQYGRDSVSMAVVSPNGSGSADFLPAVHRLLLGFDARPHWGKAHFFDRSAIDATFPGAVAFRAIREKFDPQGIFLNPHLADLFD